MKSIEFRAMGSHMLAAVDNDTPQAVTRLGQVPGWFAVWESRLSRFQHDSELSSLNQSAGAPFGVSDVLWEALQTSVNAARLSEGLVTPTVAPWVEAAGYDRSFETIAVRGSEAVAPPPAPAAWRGVRLEPTGHIVTLPVGIRLDLGGTAKGWAAERALHRLRALGPALVNAGGDIAVHGPRLDELGWAVGVSDPFQPDRSLELLSLSHGAVATSGRDYHRWKQDGMWLHHIIDPRTGLPAVTDVLSATVVAPSTVEAEVAAKVALILGSVAGLAWLEDHPPLAGLVVLAEGAVRRSRRWSRHVWR